MATNWNKISLFWSTKITKSEIKINYKNKKNKNNKKAENIKINFQNINKY